MPCLYVQSWRSDAGRLRSLVIYLFCFCSQLSSLRYAFVVYLILPRLSWLLLMVTGSTFHLETTVLVVTTAQAHQLRHFGRQEPDSNSSSFLCVQVIWFYCLEMLVLTLGLLMDWMTLLNSVDSSLFTKTFKALAIKLISFAYSYKNTIQAYK